MVLLSESSLGPLCYTSRLHNFGCMRVAVLLVGYGDKAQRFRQRDLRKLKHRANHQTSVPTVDYRTSFALPTFALQLSLLDLAIAKAGTIPRADVELRQGQNGTPPAADQAPVCLTSVRTNDGPVQLARVAVQGVVAANRGAPAQLMGAFERFQDLAVMDAEGFAKDFVKGGQVRARSKACERPLLLENTKLSSTSEGPFCAGNGTKHRTFES